MGAGVTRVTKPTKRQLMTDNQINQRANKLAAKLIESNCDNFDIGIALSLHELTEQIKQKRGVGIRLARKTAIDLLCLD